MDKYKSCSDVNQMEKEAFDFLVTGLLSKNLKGKNKQRTITAHNMEETIGNQIVPSLFYMIMYAKNDVPEKIGDDEFYDVCPLILCLSVNDKNVTGINFNFIPNILRAVILDIIEESNINFYNTVSVSNVDEIQINKALAVILSSKNGAFNFIQYIKSKTGIDISSAIRTYNKSNIVNVRLIEYDEWGYIPYLTFTDSVRGADLAKIQATVIHNQK